MAWKKSSDGLVAAFKAALPDDPAVQQRPMFGFAAAFTGGQMFSGLFEEHVTLRLPDEARAEMLARGGAPFEPMPGRSMKGYVVAAPAIVADPRELRAWIGRAFAHAVALGPKEPKAKAVPKGKAAAKKGKGA